MMGVAMALMIGQYNLDKDRAQHCVERKAAEMRAEPQLRMPSGKVEYLGHGTGTGGLQAHSIGWEYPYTIIGVQRGPEGSLRWAVMDTRNGQIGVDKATYKACEIEVASLKLRNMMNS